MNKCMTVEEILLFENDKNQYQQVKRSATCLAEAFMYLQKMYASYPKGNWVRREIMDFLSNPACKDIINNPVLDRIKRWTTTETMAGELVGFDYGNGGDLHEAIEYSVAKSKITFKDKTILEIAREANDQEMISFLVEKGAKTLAETKKDLLEKHIQKDLEMVEQTLAEYTSCRNRMKYKRSCYYDLDKLLFSCELFALAPKCIVFLSEGKDIKCPMDLGNASWVLRPYYWSSDKYIFNFLSAIDCGEIDLNIPLSEQARFLSDHWNSPELRMDMEEYINHGSKDIANMGWALKMLQERGVSEDAIVYRYLRTKGAKTPSEAMRVYNKTKRQMELRAEQEAEEKRLREEQEAEEKRLRDERRKRFLKKFCLHWLIK